MARAIKRLSYEVGRALRETGIAVDQIGLRALEKPIFKEPFAKHRPTMSLFDKHPTVSSDAFVAPNATVVGEVDLGLKSSVFYGAVLRGDQNSIRVGAYSSIGDRATVTTTKSVEGHVSAGVSIGNHVVVGPGASLCSCTLEDGSSVGAGAVVMEGALVETTARVAEGSVVHPGRRIPAGQLWAGNPAVFVRNLTKTELAEASHHAEDMAEQAQEHAHEFLPFSAVYQSAEALGVEDERIRAINAAQRAYEAGLKAQGTAHAPLTTVAGRDRKA